MSKRLLIFGDSITQGFHDSEGGWADRLKRDLLRQDESFAIFNLGISGDKVRHVLKRFGNETDTRTKRWDSFDETIVLIAIGSNDTYKEGPASSSNTSQADFAQQYKELLTVAKTQAKQVLACSIAPVDEHRTTPVSWRDISYTNDAIEAYNQVLEQLCKELDVTFVDLRQAIENVQWDELLGDGVHPNANGHAFLCKQIEPYILKII